MINTGFPLCGTQYGTLLARPGQGAFHQHIGTVTNPRHHALFTRNGQFKRVQRLIDSAT